MENEDNKSEQLKYANFLMELYAAKQIGTSLNSDNYIGNNIYFMFKRYFTSLFKWENLPKGLTSNWINKILLENGIGAFFKWKERYYFLPFNIQERDLQNGEPFIFTPKPPFNNKSDISNKNNQTSQIFNEKLIFIKSIIQKSTAVPISFNSLEYSLNNFIGEIKNRLNTYWSAMHTDLFASSAGIFLNAETGQQKLLALESRELESNVSFFKILPGQNKKANARANFFNGENNIMFNKNSSQSEIWNGFNNTLKIITQILGILDNNTNNKTSGTQETDSQIKSNRTFSTIIIADYLNTMRINLTHINTLFNLDIKVNLNENVIFEIKTIIDNFINNNKKENDDN